MEIRLKYFLILLTILNSNSIAAQVGIGVFAPDDSSILDVHSTSKGFLMPRLSTEQRDAIILPATGLMVYNYTVNDGQLNIGTPSVPNWVGIKGQADTMTDTVTEGDDTTTSDTSYTLMSGMTLSPPLGTYIVLCNAQMSNSSSFSSELGVIDVTNLHDELMAYPGGVAHALTFGSGEILAPGVYDVAGAPSIAGLLTMDGGGDPNSVFIIRGSGAFSTGIGTTVLLIGDAKPENIFWVSAVAMSTGASTIIKGTMLGGGSGAGAMSLGANSDLEGGLLTKLGAVTLGEGVILTTPSGAAPVSLGVLSTFAMWSSSGGVSDVATASTVGDVGTALGVLAMSGAHTGKEYPAGTTSSPITTSFCVYLNGVEVVNSSRATKLQSAILSLQAKVNVTTPGSIEIRWKVDEGEATLNHRVLSLIPS